MSIVHNDPVRLEPVTVTRSAFSGGELGQVRLDPAIFSVPVNVPLLHQVVTGQLASRRAGTQSTKTRAEVRGGGAKPFRQKGTGNARQGSIRAPHYAGGGIALGPKPRSYEQKTPRKMVQAALRCALSDRAQQAAVRVVDRFGFDGPKTKEAVDLLGRLGCEGTVLVVLGRDDEAAAKSFANLGYVATVPADQLTAYDVLCADVIVFSDDTLPGESEPAGAAPAAKAATKTSAAEDEDGAESGGEEADSDE
ncbi:MAG: 50S ribosomal protein L4 [Actinomycetota bacterium]|nr:50S ribosomal protein L4 [Actinomycetota bacterium]